jgi:hypothetical protein
MPSKMALSPRSPRLPSNTPPDSPRLMPSQQVVTVDLLEQVLAKIVHKLEIKDAAAKVEEAKPEASKEVKSDEPKRRASKLECKLVDEVYVFCALPMLQG